MVFSRGKEVAKAMRKVNFWKENVFFFLMVVLVFCLLFFLPIISNADPLDNWHMRNPLPQTQSNSLSGVFYGNNTFVATGWWNGMLLTSADGTEWTVRTSGIASGLTKAAYGNNTFVVMGVDGIILTSPDGISWTAVNFVGKWGNQHWVGPNAVNLTKISWRKPRSGENRDMKKA